MRTGDDGHWPQRGQRAIMALSCFVQLSRLVFHQKLPQFPILASALAAPAMKTARKPCLQRSPASGMVVGGRVGYEFLVLHEGRQTQSASLKNCWNLRLSQSLRVGSLKIVPSNIRQDSWILKTELPHSVFKKWSELEEPLRHCQSQRQTKPLSLLSYTIALPNAVHEHVN